MTPFDNLSKHSHAGHQQSPPHAILENEHSFRYYDQRTQPLDDHDSEAVEALAQLRLAIARVHRVSVVLVPGDLLSIPNQNGLHARCFGTIRDPAALQQRWLLKTYNFASPGHLAVFLNRFVEGQPGLVREKEESTQTGTPP